MTPKMSRGRRVLYVQYANPGAYPPLQHSARILAGSGAQVLMLGVVNSYTEQLRFTGGPALEIRNLKACSPGIRQKLHYFQYWLWVAWTVVHWRPTWIYASDSLSAPIALFLTYWPNLRVIYHEHDTPAELNDPATSSSSAMRLVLSARNALARRTELCILPNAIRAARFKKETKTTRPIVCVWNCPSRAEAPELKTTEKEDGLRLFFHGSIVPERLPLTLIQALVMLQTSVTLQFAGYETVGHQGYIAEFLSQAAKQGVSERISYLGSFPREELLTLCAHAQVGLSLVPIGSNDLSMDTMVGASNKPFDYLLSGLALLVSDIAEWNETFVGPRLGLACDPADAASVSTAVRWFLDHPEERREIGKRGRKRVLSDWNYERQFAPVLAGMRSAEVGL